MHFKVNYIKFDNDGKAVFGKITNVGDEKVECMEIFVSIKDKSGTVQEIRIPVDATRVQVGESTMFKKELDFEAEQKPIKKFTIKTGPKVRGDGYFFEDCKCRPILGIKFAKPIMLDDSTCKEFGMEEQSTGIRIIELIARSPAERCGLKMDDVVFECDSVNIYHIRQLDSLVRCRQIDDTLKMEVLRDKQKLSIPAVLM